MMVIGFGFFWIFAWCIFGSILGVQIEQLTLSLGEFSGQMQRQRELLKSAHAHMNSMGITTILVGLSIRYIESLLSRKKIKIIVIFNLASIPIFGLGIVCEAFLPAVASKITFTTAISALGGIIYIISIAIWASLFLFNALKKNGQNEFI